MLRSSAGRAGRFQVFSGLEIARKLVEFDWNVGRPCHDFQCAFDAGNILMADYVLYGTLTPLDGLHVWSFNILEIRSGRVVFSVVDHAPANPGAKDDVLLQARLADFAAGLEPSSLRGPGKSSRGVIAVVPSGEESTESRVLAERLGTRIHSNRTFDLMSQVELRELLSAMEIPLGASAASDSEMLDLGARMKAAYLVKSEMGRRNGGQRLDLALFDIAGKRRIGSWSSQSSGGYRDILKLEARIFPTLDELTASGWDAAEKVEVPPAGSPWVRGLLTLAGLAAAGGIGSWAYALHEQANQAHREAEAAMSPQAGRVWKRKTEERDLGTLFFGSLAALTFGATVTVWAF